MSKKATKKSSVVRPAKSSNRRKGLKDPPSNRALGMRLLRSR